MHTPKTEAGKRKIPMLQSVREAFLEEKKFQEQFGLKCIAEIDGYTDFIFINRFGGVQHQGTPYMSKLSGDENLFYTILEGVGLQKKIRMNPYWRKLLLKNFSVIQSWVQYNKAQFLQDRNPEVPGVIYKICPENVELRKLDQARDLWLEYLLEMSKLRPEDLGIEKKTSYSFPSDDELDSIMEE